MMSVPPPVLFHLDYVMLCRRRHQVLLLLLQLLKVQCDDDHEYCQYVLYTYIYRYAVVVMCVNSTPCSPPPHHLVYNV
ncbi:unnamed protein product [Trichobilharzia regenti]|nr:unnamed protein product [Trichobilharzia regenti]